MGIGLWFNNSFLIVSTRYDSNNGCCEYVLINIVWKINLKLTFGGGKKKKFASAGNRTRAARVAGEHSTTEPPMLLLCSDIEIKIILTH